MEQIVIPPQEQNVPEQPMPVIHRKKMYLFPIVSLLIVFSGLMVTLIMIKKPQDIRNRAAVTGPKLTMAPASITAEIGQTVSVGVTMNTDEDTVSAAELRLSYDPTALEIISFAPSTALPVVLTPETHTDGALSVTLGAQPTSPFKGNDIVGTWTIKILTEKQSFLRFADSTQVAALGKTTNAVVSSTGSTITGTTVPAHTPTITSTPQPTPSPTRATHPTPTAPPVPKTTVTPTLTPTHAPAPTAPHPVVTQFEGSKITISKITFFDRIFMAIIDFFMNLFQSREE